LWFAGNGIMNALMNNYHLEAGALGHLTSAIQFGFITGTFFFALFNVADRFSPSRVFLVSALAGALFNGIILWPDNTFFSLLVLRFITGFFLAGIYPVGMKIAADYYEKGLGKSLGFLVGALVLGTAFPHLLKSFLAGVSWKLVIVATSSLAVVGGLFMVFLVPDGPFRKPALKMEFSVLFQVFKDFRLKQAAFGYFGHMWELYTFWAFVPVMLSTYLKLHPNTYADISGLSFSVIGIGGVACALAGYFSQKLGTKKIAFSALLLSCLCCLSSYLFFQTSFFVFFIFLLFWGMVVIADSPLFSTLVAQNAASEIKGTALTIVNCIGFSITIISIQLMNVLYEYFDTPLIYAAMAIGPVFGLVALYKSPKRSVKD